MAIVMQFETLPETCDVAVVGAGVAGSMTALSLARDGFDVVLIERDAWPRDKVCGGCLNNAALHEFERRGLARITTRGAPFNRMLLADHHGESAFSLPEGRAITRRSFDARLASEAVAAGARFLPNTHASLGATNVESRQLDLRSSGHRATLSASIVLDCSGLSGRLSDTATNSKPQVSGRAYIGVGSVLAHAPAVYVPGVIHMACGRHGYVGLVRGENNTANVGAAFDPMWLKRCGGPSAGVAEILRSTGFAPLDDEGIRWQGTPRLTRRRACLGAYRLLTLGDAAGYVEPFTGEGMAWAIADAAAVHPFVHAAVERWRDDIVMQWTRRHNRLVGRRQLLCRGLTRGLRHPRLLAASLPIIAATPGLTRPLTALLNRRFHFDTTTTI